MFGMYAFEHMTTRRRVLLALLVESWLYSDEQFTGVDQGGFVYQGKFHYTSEWLIRVATLKMSSWLTDEEIDAIVIGITPEWAYVAWWEVEEHISWMHKNGGDA